MRAYLIGYRHGIIDGHMADLINQGKCEAMQDESLDVEYAPIDRVLEIIDDADKKAGDKTYIVLDDGSFYSQVKYIKEKMLELLEEGGDVNHGI